MPKNCDNCKYDLFRLCGEEDKTPCDDCYNGNPPTKWEPGENYEPKTNADRIRAMSDVELAETLVRHDGEYDVYRTDCEGVHYDWVAAVNEELEWLQQPAEGE